ncbi:MAG: hypothetical protein DRN10_03200 [Thermoplasmata archaeon]|nr:MAG: hypothetical protein DRN10_03200 [Thermoplasmata archaeon]
MKKIDSIEIIEAYPAAYIKPLDTIIIADLHLGYETIAAENGVFLPKIQYNKTIEKIKKIINKTPAKNIIINGDIKHEFSETSYHEYKEVKNFFEFLNHIGFEKIIVLKGNHDNFIINITRKYDNIELYDEIAINNFFITHGHKDKKLSEIKQENIILAHEHPSIGLYTDIGVKEKLKCFLYGKIKSKNIVVLPAFSYFAQGSDINLIPKNELLSPILKKIDVDNLKAIGILEDDEKLLEFPEIGKIRE